MGKTDKPETDITRRPVVLSLPEMRKVTVQTLQYPADSGVDLELDIYSPPTSSQGDAPASGRTMPVIVLVTGHKDLNIEVAVGCPLKDTEQYRSWGRLLAGSGLLAVTYANRNPERDSYAVLEYLSANADALAIDMQRLGVWSCSANVPNALGLIMSERFNIACAAFLYGYMLDRGNCTFVADAASVSGFAAPNAGRTIDDLPAALKLRIVRAGADEFPGINQTIDDFCADALARNMDLTLVNHPHAPHSFDILDDSAQTKAIIQDTLTFFSASLGGKA